MRSISLVLVAMVLTAGCGSAALPTAADSDAVRAQSRWPSTTAAELNRGRALYLGHCSNCHLPVPPARFTAAVWPKHVGDMRKRAGLTAIEAEAVQRYLMTMAQVTAEK